MKDEIKNLKMGSGSIVCSEGSTGMGLGSGTFAWPPPLTSRWNEIFIPRKMVAFKVSQTMKLRNSRVILEEWCHNKPKSGLIGTKPRRNKEPGRGRLWSCGSSMKRTW